MAQRRKHAWSVLFVQPVRKGLGETLWLQVEKQLSLVLGEMNSSSTKQAGKQPRAEKENPPPLSCYRETLQGLRMAGCFGCSVQLENKQIAADNSRSSPFNR